MKKITLLFITILFSTLTYAQNVETFDNLDTSGTTYVDGAFLGVDDIEWTFFHARSEGSFPIDGSGIMLRRSDEPSRLLATLPNGIGDFSVDTRKAFTNNDQRRIELVINGDVIQQFEPQFGDGADDTIIPFEVSGIDISGDVNLEIRLFGANGNQQIVLDNLTWTDFPETLRALSFEESGIELYPNPVSNGVLNIQSAFTNDLDIQLFNRLGQQVLTSKTSKNINVSNLRSGVYLVKINHGSSSLTKKVVIK